MLKWTLCYAPHEICKNNEPKTISELTALGYESVPAVVPGNFELDLMREKRLPDLYFSTDTLEAEKLENLHIWYYTSFDLPENGDPEGVLRFEGVDTIGDIYLNGVLKCHTDNMFLPYEIKDGFHGGHNEVVVHIKPACLAARDHTLPISSHALPYNYASLALRKAAYMFGWDIMPRIVSAGLWKDVKLLPPEQKNEIRETYFVTNRVDTEKKQASLRFHYRLVLDGDFARDYTVKVRGKCGNSEFSFSTVPWHTDGAFDFSIQDCLFWAPRPQGVPNLYEVTVELYRGDLLCDAKTLELGVRTVRLLMTECAGDDGEFCFEINGKKTFLLGTNWVPLDAFPSRFEERLPKALEMLNDIGCNAVRCWGGGVYESDEFYRFCDRKGILVWQDFGMGCGVYPQERTFAERLEKEIVAVVKRLREHACIVLWAGDNENDCAYMEWMGYRKDPNENFLTRETVKRAVKAHDYARPYLASSPYIGEEAYRTGKPTSEDHLWGPRDYFKGDFYRNAQSHFASETGYHGFPSVSSLKRFLKQPEVIFKPDGTPTDEYLVHAAMMETNPNGPYSYRIRLAYSQVETLFGKAESDLADFVKESQISQAEAKKYFIERFRIGKWRRTGILWWNLVDGWPQVSDAIVDWYYTKKLAYHYIKRSQAPVCLVFDEPDESGALRLVGVNDLAADKTVTYSVKDVLSGKTVLSGTAKIAADSSQTVAFLPLDTDKMRFYLIEWQGDETGRNHYTANMPNIDYKTYLKAIEQCGMDEFED